MANNKNTVLLLVGAGALAYFLFMKSKQQQQRVIVTADSPEIQSSDQYEADYQEAAPAPVAATPLQAITSAVSKLFPKKSKEQKAAKKTARVAKRAARKAKKKVAGFDETSVLY